MYNDYYLEQINNKIATSNGLLNEIIENQTTLVSGDITIHNDLETIKEQNIMLQIIVMAILLYLFIVRCLK